MILQCVAATYSRVCVIIDAPDECQTSKHCRSRFLSEIFTLQEKCSANIFMTSRFIPEITEQLSRCTTLEVGASDEDVQRYLEGHMG